MSKRVSHTDLTHTDLTRRSLIKGLAVLVPAASTLGACVMRDPESTAVTQAPTFFKPDEAAFMDAATQRLIPADAASGGAIEAGVPRFIDLQLGGEFGRAERWYMRGPWPQGTDEEGYQLRLTPAQVYRAAIAEINTHCRAVHEKPFAQLTADQQDAILHALEAGSLKLERVPAQTFFSLLWQNTQEGYLADPVYGGNRDFAGWKLIGFPGPRYNYLEEITQYGKPYTEPYVSLAGRDPGRRLRRT